jgi:hypothetical protein
VPSAGISTQQTFIAQTLSGALEVLLSACPSEVRCVSPRHIGVLFRVPLDVFGANLFPPFIVLVANWISHGRGPRRREDAFILNRESELQGRSGNLMLCQSFTSFDPDQNSRRYFEIL